MNIISNKVYEELQVPDIRENTYPSTILYANEFSDVPPVSMPDDIRSLLDDYNYGLAGTCNILVQLQRIFDNYPDGPWFVDSRNGMIYIHNHRKVAIPDYDYIYYQEEGEVLEININTNWVTKKVSGSIISSGIDETGQQKFSINNPENSEQIPDAVSLPTVENINSVPYMSITGGNPFIFNSPLYTTNEIDYRSIRMEEERRIKEEEERLRARNASEAPKVLKDPNGYRTKAFNSYVENLNDHDTQVLLNKVLKEKFDIGAQEKIREYVNKGDEEGLKAYVSNSPLLESNNPALKGFPEIKTVDYVVGGEVADINADPNKVLLNKRTSTRERLGPIPITVHHKDYVDFNGRPLIDINFLFENFFSRRKKSDGSGQFDNNGNLISNKIQSLKEKEITMQLRVIGRPTLTSSQTLYIGNIGKKWSGMWYVKTCIHQMDSNGYTCSLTLSKGPSSKSNVNGVALTTGKAVSNDGSVSLEGNTVEIQLTVEEKGYLIQLSRNYEAVKRANMIGIAAKRRMLSEIENETRMFYEVKSSVPSGTSIVNEVYTGKSDYTGTVIPKYELTDEAKNIEKKILFDRSKSRMTELKGKLDKLMDFKNIDLTQSYNILEVPPIK